MPRDKLQRVRVRYSARGLGALKGEAKAERRGHGYYNSHSRTWTVVWDGRRSPWRYIKENIEEDTQVGTEPIRAVAGA